MIRPSTPRFLRYSDTGCSLNPRWHKFSFLLPTCPLNIPSHGMKCSFLPFHLANDCSSFPSSARASAPPGYLPWLAPMIDPPIYILKHHYVFVALITSMICYSVFVSSNIWKTLWDQVPFWLVHLTPFQELVLSSSSKRICRMNESIHEWMNAI